MKKYLPLILAIAVILTACHPQQTFPSISLNSTTYEVVHNERDLVIPGVEGTHYSTDPNMVTLRISPLPEESDNSQYNNTAIFSQSYFLPTAEKDVFYEYRQAFSCNIQGSQGSQFDGQGSFSKGYDLGWDGWTTAFGFAVNPENSFLSGLRFIAYEGWKLTFQSDEIPVTNLCDLNTYAILWQTAKVYGYVNGELVVAMSIPPNSPIRKTSMRTQTWIDSYDVGGGSITQVGTFAITETQETRYSLTQLGYIPHQSDPSTVK